jgi:hypothetical protein
MTSWAHFFKRFAFSVEVVKNQAFYTYSTITKLANSFFGMGQALDIKIAFTNITD